ncbi:hypothetical protein DsansV1_C26g0193691 [Dioscorea sansibarensis]
MSIGSLPHHPDSCYLNNTLVIVPEKICRSKQQMRSERTLEDAIAVAGVPEILKTEVALSFRELVTKGLLQLRTGGPHYHPRSQTLELNPSSSNRLQAPRRLGTIEDQRWIWCSTDSKNGLRGAGRKGKEALGFRFFAPLGRRERESLLISCQPLSWPSHVRHPLRSRFSHRGKRVFDAGNGNAVITTIFLQKNYMYFFKITYCFFPFFSFF